MLIGELWRLKQAIKPLCKWAQAPQPKTPMFARRRGLCKSCYIRQLCHGLQCIHFSRAGGTMHVCHLYCISPYFAYLMRSCGEICISLVPVVQRYPYHLSHLSYYLSVTGKALTSVIHGLEYNTWPVTELCVCLHSTEHLYQRLQFPGILQHHQCVSGTAGTEGERWKKKMNLEFYVVLSQALTLHYCSIVITMLEIVFFVVYNLRILCMCIVYVCM